MKYLKWVFWNCYYTVRKPKTFVDFIVSFDRCRAPWWKWKPSVARYEDSKRWEVWLSDGRCFTERRTITTDVMVSIETGEIIGIELFDETLKA